jgi:hypothetical protein
MIKEDVHGSNGKIATPSAWQSQPGNWLAHLDVCYALVEAQVYPV